MSAERITDIPIPNECKNCIFSAFKQFQPRWIPVEEHLPEDERYVLVTTVSGDVTEAKYWQKEGFWVLKGLVIMSVLAWMPLPKPYERSEE